MTKFEAIGGREGIEFQASLLALGAAIENADDGRISLYRPASEQVNRMAAQYVRAARIEPRDGSAVKD